MATEALDKIVAGTLPGLELVEPTPATGADRQRVAIKPGPSLATLRAKYLGYAADSGKVSSATSQGTVEVRQARSRTSGPNGPTRTLIFSEKGLIGSQG